MRFPSETGSGARHRFSLGKLSWLVVISVLAACEAEPDAPLDYARVAARVNGTEITVRHLEEQLADAGVSPAADAVAVRRLLDALIDEQLLVQKAKETGLENEAAVRRAMERSRRQLLTQALIDAAAPVAVSTREAKAFYSENPELFLNRKVFTFQRFDLERKVLDSALKDKLDAARRTADVASILKAAGIPFTRMTEARPAESLPDGLLAEAARMSVGDILLYRRSSGTVLMQLSGRVHEPLGFKDALPAIRAYLEESKRQRNAALLVKELRREAKIEYPAQTSRASRNTEVAGAKPALVEPPSQKLLQSRQTTFMR
jgi:EpsD family peptidyl-prolyl cis-trans isomerase